MVTPAFATGMSGPFYMRRGPVGCLLVHGYTDSPGAVRSLGDRLAAQGVTVRCDLLPGHEGDPARLDTLTWRAWSDAVIAAHDQLAAECPVVFAAGLSFGGTLALHLATHRPLAGLVAMAPMLATIDRSGPWAGYLRHVMPSPRKKNGPDVANPKAYATYSVYDRIPLGGVAQAFALIHHVRQDLGQIRCPVLVLHGKGDHTVPLASAHEVVESVASTDRRLVVLPNSYHVVTVDLDRDLLEQEVVQFVHRVGTAALAAG